MLQVIFHVTGLSLDFRGFRRRGSCVFPGQPEDGDFLGCWLVRARCLKSGGDDDAAELGGHVGGGGLGLAGVPRGGRAAFVQVGGVVAGGGVPGDGDGLAGDLEREGPLDGSCGAVAGLAGAEDLLRVLDRDLDGPAGRVPLDYLFRRGRPVGGDEGDAEAAAGLVADDDDGDRAGSRTRSTTGR